MKSGKEKNKKKKGISIKALKEKLKECEKERDEYLLGWKRARADFINYKKEEAEQFENRIRRSEEGLVQELILILDSFDLCVFSSKNDAVEKEGVKLIQNQLYDSLRKNGLERIEVKPGEKFDPNFHEAIERVESKQVSDTIIKEIKKGYFFKGKILRPSKVKISK